jgi:glutamate-1-semialdehyde 2,1-aminomutase
MTWDLEGGEKVAQLRFMELFESRTRKSRALWEEAKKSLPGGVAGRAAFLAPNPVYVEKAVGGNFVDVDGNEYIDLLLGGFPHILGHSPPPVVQAVKTQAERGTSTELFNELGIKLAKKMQQFLPHLEMVRFCNTGSEATMFAIRAARAWTKKEKIAKPEGGYSGQHDYVLASSISGRTAGSADRPIPIADCAGIPQFIIDNTIILPWNNIHDTVSILKEHAHELAAVVLEPVQGFGMGAIPADREYLEAIRGITAENNIVFIYDEVVTGFRIGGMGGAVKHYGVIPDLGCYGKIIGGGLPVGAYGGRRDIMEQTCNPDADPEFRIFQSGTFTGNQLTMAAGLACLTELETKDYSYIDDLAEKLRVGIQKIGTEQDFKMQVTGIASIFYVHFNDHPVWNMRDKLKDDAAKNYEFSMGMVVNGVYLSPAHTGALCFAHTQEDIDYILSVTEKVLTEMKQ